MKKFDDRLGRVGKEAGTDDGRQFVPPQSMNRYRALSIKKVRSHRGYMNLSPQRQFEIEVVSRVLPFKVNEYVLDHLLDWDDVDSDPMFKLLFPQREMLSEHSFDLLADLVRKGAGQEKIDRVVRGIREEMNPNPADQSTLNVPQFAGREVAGIQHKYKQTVLFFPAPGQTCHAYCTFCFRWPQFVRGYHRFAASDHHQLHNYLRDHPDVTDLLITGGDPMIMGTRRLSAYLLPLLEDASLAHVSNIRIGTKSLTYWPQRFISDSGADEFLRLIERLVLSGRHVSIMAHINHWKEMEPDLFKRAVRRLQNAGALVRSQSPLLATINDSSSVWSKLWSEQVRLGIIPYYMFVERDTGPMDYFRVPLARAHTIFYGAYRDVSGLARTVRGPSMSCGPGKIELCGSAIVGGERVLVLRFIQARQESWVGEPFFAAYDEHAAWIDELRPAFKEDSFFFSDEYSRVSDAPVSLESCS